MNNSTVYKCVLEKKNIEFFESLSDPPPVVFNTLPPTKINDQDQTLKIAAQDQTLKIDAQNQTPIKRRYPYDIAMLQNIDPLTFLYSLGESVPPNIINILNSPPANINLNTLTDLDTNYLLNIFQNFITQKNSLLDDIKLGIDNAYNSDYTILNVSNDQIKKSNLANLLINILRSNINKYNILRPIFKINNKPATSDDSFTSIFFLLDFVPIDINIVDVLLTLLKNIETIAPILYSLWIYYSNLDPNNKLEISNAFSKFNADFNSDTYMKIREDSMKSFKNIIDNNLIKPFLNNKCSPSNKDCSSYYSESILSFITTFPMNDKDKGQLLNLLVNANVKTKLMNILKMNYLSVSAVVECWNEITYISDSKVYIDLDLLKKTKDTTIQKKLQLQFFKDYFMNKIYNMLNKIKNTDTNTITISTMNQEIIHGLPNLYFYIGIGLFAIIILLILKK